MYWYTHRGTMLALMICFHETKWCGGGGGPNLKRAHNIEEQMIIHKASISQPFWLMFLVSCLKIHVM